MKTNMEKTCSFEVTLVRWQIVPLLERLESSSALQALETEQVKRLLLRGLQRGFASDQSSRFAPRLSFFVAEASSLRTFCSAAGSRSYGLCYAVFDLQKLTASPRDDSRIAADLDWRLKAPLDHKVNGNSAFFSRSEKATFVEILKLDSKSQLPHTRKSEAVAH